MAKILRFLLFIPLLLILNGCSQGNSHKSNVVRINLGNDPTTLDPRAARDLQSIAVMKMLFEGLTRVGLSDQPELALANSVEISADLKTFTFHLRDSKWTSGQSVTAEDFVYAWKTALRPEFVTTQAFQLYLIKNAKLIKEGKLEADQLGARVLDPNTLLVELEYPTPYFLELLAQPIFFPVPAALDAQHIENFVCNGPFRPTQWLHGDRLVLEKNSAYWDQKAVKLDGIELLMVSEDTELKLFEMGELDWAGSPFFTLPVDALPSLNKKGIVHVKPILGTAFIRTNVETIPFNDPLMRKAFALALLRKDLIDHVVQGGQIPATGFVPTVFGLQKEPYFSDGSIEEARKLFNQALEKNHLTRESLPKITLTYASGERNHLMAQAMQEQWREVLGIPVILESIERKVYYDRVSKQDFQLVMSSWIADFNDPINFLEMFKYKMNSTNNTQWEDPHYSDLLSTSFGCLDLVDRSKILASCEKILIDAMPIIPLYHYTMNYVKNDKLQDVVMNGLGQLDFKWAHLDNDKL